MKKFNTILELSLAIEKVNGQLSLEILLNRRANFGNGWEDFTMEQRNLSHLVREVFVQQI